MAITSVAISPANDIVAGSIRRSDSCNDLRCDLGGRMRRSRSEPVLRCSMSSRNASPKATAAKIMKTSRSVGIFPFNSILPSSLKSFFVDEESTSAMRLVDGEEDDVVEEVEFAEGLGSENEKRANWVERLLELRRRWRDRQNDDEEEDVDYYCGVNYDSKMEEEEEEFDREKFSKFLSAVPWPETKLFSQLAFLCNMAYVIPEIKAEDLRKYYDLRLVTSSLEKKSEAATKAKIDSDSTPPPSAPNGASGREDQRSEKQRPNRPSVAYEIAASAASYVQSRAKGLLSLAATQEEESEEMCGGERPYKREMAAFVAASTMTTVVAAEEEARLEAARDLRSLYSSPCEWFVCDDPSTSTRCFVTQGSDSLASWQANLFFEPTKFEGMEVLVHRGIYEAAKGIYEQFMPEILAHLRAHGDRAKFRFAGHSLGGSLSLLVSLMLVARGVVPACALLPVVTFGSPSVFCGGKRVLDELGLDEGNIRSVMMHRDIVPRAFSCNYPNHVAHVLKRLNGAFRTHPCLNNQKLLYSPLGKLFILQPDDKSSPPHPLLPPGAALYALQHNDGGSSATEPGSGNSALRAFINLPHPLETLSDPTAYGSDGTILRDHDSSNYLKALNGLLRQRTKSFVRKSRRRQRPSHWWPPLTNTPGSHGSWIGHRESALEKSGLVAQEVVTGV